jgi:hypothetical protein
MSLQASWVNGTHHSGLLGRHSVLLLAANSDEWEDESVASWGCLKTEGRRRALLWGSASIRPPRDPSTQCAVSPMPASHIGEGGEGSYNNGGGGDRERCHGSDDGVRIHGRENTGWDSWGTRARERTEGRLL